MTSLATNAPHRPSPHAQAAPAVRAIGWLMAVWCVGFAMVNIVLENTDYLADGEYADHAAALMMMNWLVVGLKLLGARGGAAIGSEAPAAAAPKAPSR